MALTRQGRPPATSDSCSSSLPPPEQGQIPVTTPLVLCPGQDLALPWGLCKVESSPSAG